MTNLFCLSGTVRTTRDRAKREANVGQHHHNNHHNNSNNHANNNNHHQREREQSNGAAATAAHQQRHQSQSPANVSGGGLAAASGQQAASKTRQQLQQQHHQQQHQQQQQQRSLDMESSTESDGEATNGNGGNTTTATNTTSASNGPMTRKVWSDWCSSKGKSSQSDDEENNNSNSNGGSNGGSMVGGTVGRQARAATQKKRKKLTRKAAIASKSAAAAQREAEAVAAAAAAALASKDSSSKEDQPRAASAGPGRKGRMKKGARGRKSLKIVGLEALHKQTVLSTSLDSMTKKLPAAPGTVDQQLTALLTENMAHTELDIPAAPQDTPYALQILLDVFRSQYTTMIEHMKSSAYVPQVQKQIAQEQERMARLKNRASQLDKQIKVFGIDIIDTIKFVCDELPSMSSAFEETNLHQIDTACYKTMTGLVDRFNKAVDSIVALVSAFFFILSLYLQQEKIIRKEKLRKQNEFRFLRKCCQS